MTHDNIALSTAISLRNAGIAVHWLKEKSKAPVEAGWSEAPVATLEELHATYRPGFNVGLRTGEPSQVAGLFVHVIDTDIRFPDLADEAWAAFDRLFPGLRETLPSVVSGSGSESRHHYLLTDKPFFGKKLAVSEDKIRGADGKWHAMWEIDLFGTGRQVAAPGSIHPVTGLPYRWEREFDFDGFDQPIVSSARIEALGVADTTTYDFESRPPLDFKPGRLEADLDVLPVSRWDDRADWVMIGQALHHQFGGSDEGFDLWARFSAKSAKCDKDFRRANLRRWRSFGRNRRAPVTMGTVRQWAQDARLATLADEFDDLDAAPAETGGDDFDDLITAPAANDDDWDGGKAEKPTELSWTSLLAMDSQNKGYASNLHNLELIVKNDPRLVGLPQLNEFTQETVQRTLPGVKGKRRANQAKPTRELSGRVWQVKDRVNGDIWSSARDYAIRSTLEAPRMQGGYGIKVSDRDLKAATVLAANEHAFHPIREYLSALQWDATARVERLFVDYLGCDDTPYTRDVARLMMIAAVTRVFEPGAKWDHAVILEGVQGTGKSTFISILARSWGAELDGNFHDDKQMVEKLQGSWILEMPELSGFNKADVLSIKAFITRRVDKVRLAYEARASEFPRQSILIGSTNDREYLRDSTGGRRFFPVECHVDQIPNHRLRAEVDQLWAEAYALYKELRADQPHGDLPLYLTGEAAAEEARRLQESRRVESVEDATAGKIAEWLEAPVSTGLLDDGDQMARRTKTCLAQIWVEALGNEWRTYNQPAAQTLGRAMKLVPGWSVAKGAKVRIKPYGQQRAYVRHLFGS